MNECTQSILVFGPCVYISRGSLTPGHHRGRVALLSGHVLIKKQLLHISRTSSLLYGRGPPSLAEPCDFNIHTTSRTPASKNMQH